MTLATAMPFARRWARSVGKFCASSTPRHVGRGGTAVLSALVLAMPAAAQEHPEDEEPTPPVQAATLTLEEAINLARANNPTYRATANDESVAHWRVREAYSQFLPSFGVSSRLGYTAEGTQRVGGAASQFDVTTPTTYTSSYGINLGMNIGGATFFRTAEAKANSRAVEARIGAEGFTLAADVTARYLAALRARDGVEIAQSALESAEQALNLARARLEVGDATRLEVTRAEVEYGRAEVGLIQADNLLETEMLVLLQQMGVAVDGEIELTSTFEVFEPTWVLDELVATALELHPQVVAMRANEHAMNASSRAAKMSYLPTISISGGWGGFVRRAGSDAFNLQEAEQSAQNQMQSCSDQNALFAPLPAYQPVDCQARFALTDEARAAVLAQNDAFPFDFDTNPFSAGVTVSLPIFDGFSREVQLQAAQVAADDARHERRAEELNRRTQVATNLLALNAAYRTVAIEERNVEAADEALLLERERYRLGAGTIVELTDAQRQKVTADQDYLAAIYDFHQSLAALEAAIGRQLR